jgi:hypothetical protein
MEMYALTLQEIKLKKYEYFSLQRSNADFFNLIEVEKILDIRV